MARSITVVVSQGQSHHPAKRQLEEDIVAALLGERGVDVTIVPHLYDLRKDSSGMLYLEGVTGDMVVCSWLYPRAAHWTLDRNGIRGQVGETLLVGDDEDEEEETSTDEASEEKPRVADELPIPNRKIYCLDLRVSSRAEDFVGEVRRIAAEKSTQTVELGSWIEGNPQPQQMARFLSPTAGNVDSSNGSPESSAPTNGSMDNGTAANGDATNGAATNGAATNGAGTNGSITGHDAAGQAPATPTIIEEEPDRRWYPVIDFSRCTNCLECIDFCLFGVYGIDKVETILVEQPDNCRKGCPACSRVCPENAIIFPQHKTPAIAGSAEVAESLKIDLSKLFGAPDLDAVEVAVRERDEQLAVVGRDMVGHEVGLEKRQARDKEAERDELDDLMDQLDESGL